MPFEIISHDTHIDFISRWKLCVVASLAVILAGFVAAYFEGVHLGIDFAGGSEVQVKFAAGVDADEGRIREIVGTMPEISDPTVVRFGSAAENEFLIKFKGSIEDQPPTPDADGSASADATDSKEAETGSPDELSSKNKAVLLMKALNGGIGDATLQRVEFVGPRVGEELRRDGLLSLFWASVFIMIYVALRFSSRFAPGAVVAVIHDVLVTAAVFVILGQEFDLRILAAMLAILGYSLNDTIIIYDRIRENLETHTTADLPGVLNLSVNQTLSRTVLTSGTTLLAVLALYLLGGEVIRPFALAMLIGIFVGTYSSIFIASPILLVLENRFGGPKSGAKGGGKKKAKKTKPEYGVV